VGRIWCGGGKYQDTRVLSGFGGAGVLEVIKDYRGDTLRTVYTLKYAGTVYVLHAFQEVEEWTANTAPENRINQTTIARGRTDCEGEKAMSNKKRYETGSGNVFRDIGVPNAEEHLVKAQLVFKIGTILKKRGLKQVEAAELFGVRQPECIKDVAGRVPPVLRRTLAALPGGA
jgi:predicted XRE-type DNA-binding protein